MPEQPEPVDVMTCPRCRGPMRPVKLANTPAKVAGVLAELGERHRNPTNNAGMVSTMDSAC